MNKRGHRLGLDMWCEDPPCGPISGTHSLWAGVLAGDVKVHHVLSHDGVGHPVTIVCHLWKDKYILRSLEAQLCTTTQLQYTGLLPWSRLACAITCLAHGGFCTEHNLSPS